MQTFENQRHTATEPSQVLLLYDRFATMRILSLLVLAYANLAASEEEADKNELCGSWAAKVRRDRDNLLCYAAQYDDSQPLSLSSQCNRANANTMSTI
jgi:hypothetical protein